MKTDAAEPKRTMKVTITPEFQTAYKTVEEGENLLILGSAGTGKSTFLKWLRKKLGYEKSYVVLAPTGMAALQVGGQTIHSFFGFKSQLLSDKNAWRKPRSKGIFENLDLIIIDEISMVRADVFEAMDRFLRQYGPNKKEPFGGIQILAMGDLFQLPPIVRGEEKNYFREIFGTPFFFGSQAWKNGQFSVVEFTQIFRQSDAPFIDLLTRVRHGERNTALLQTLNQNVKEEAIEGAVILAARNQTVENINETELARLKTGLHTYEARTTGKSDPAAFTSPQQLQLKTGARVMFTRNDPNGKWVNGTLGEVISCNKTDVTVRTDNGKEYAVAPVKWELTTYEFDEEKKAAVSTVAGTFSQLPLTLAWALTIHKSQGQTLDQCVVDLSDGGAFAEGQLYVALSRARSLETLQLKHPVQAKDIRTSPDVKRFYQALYQE